MIFYPYEVFVGSDILEFSFELPNSLVSVFIEDDRVPTIPEEERGDDSSPEYRYEATVKIIRDRLEIMGYTSARWREELEDYRQLKLAETEELIAEAGDEGQPTLKASRTALILEQSTPERWINSLLAIFWNRWEGRRRPRSWALEKALTDGEYGPIQIPFGDRLCLLRAAIDLHEDAETVRFEFSNAVWNEDVDPATAFTRNARMSLLEGAQAIEKVVILTEGKADTRILQASLERLYPHLKHMYSFLDHSAFKAQGGTGELERLARGFAGAGVSNRIVALFDNDTAGAAAAQRLSRAGLPANFRILTLPDLGPARSYPTIGPTGPALADINGRACGIELYCGPMALTGEDGQLCPIQWTGYDSGMNRYQGEPLEKERIKERFYEVLERSPDPQTDPELSSIRLILQSVMQIQW
ncbi:MAG: HEPN/Toprim-associated domain-containing protein [Terracidiphilus sp.]|jgi:DNA primase